MTVNQQSKIYLTGLDWSAALWAGLVSGLVMLIVSVLLPWMILGDALLIIRIMASVVLGPSVIPAQAGLVPGIYVAALLTHFAFSLIFTLLITLIFHRYGILVAFWGGAIVGFLIYIINYYTFSFIFPWMALYLNWMVLVAHIVFGALAGSLYELFEDTRFVDEPFFRNIEPTLVKTNLSHVTIWGKEGE